jgi:hypothetical protein
MIEASSELEARPGLSFGGGLAGSKQPEILSPSKVGHGLHRDEGLRARGFGRGHMSTNDWLSMKIFINHESS